MGTLQATLSLSSSDATSDSLSLSVTDNLVFSKDVIQKD